MSKPFLVLLLLFLAFNGKAQQVFLEGVVLADSSRKPVSGARIYSKSGTGQALTDQNGYFKLSLERGRNELLISHVAYAALKSELFLTKDHRQTFYLKSGTQFLNEVEISGNKGAVLQSNLNNYHLLKRADLEKGPAFLGVHDLIKTIQTLPGIGKGGEGNSGLFVRGGSSGQNLVLFNHSVVYNPSHLLGFFSVFNHNAVEEVKFYKSGIPSEYGGRLSAVIDIRSDQEVADSLRLEGELSVLAMSLNLKIPVTKKWSFATSMRKTFMNHSVWPIVNRLGNKDENSNQMRYDFYDLNFSSALSLTKKDRLFATFYMGGDDFGFDIRRFQINNGMDWQNSAASINWNRMVSDKVVMDHTLSYSGYRFNFGMQQEGFKIGVQSAIRDFTYRSALQFYLDQHQLKAGLELSQHKFKPNTPSARNGLTDFDYGIPNTYFADEAALFLSDDYKFSERLSVYGGLRLTWYRHKGPYSLTGKDGSVVAFPKGQTLSDELFMEPSFTLRYHLNKNTALKISYSKNVQTIHLIPVTASNFPSDFWMPSINGVPPEKGNQYSLGIFKEWGTSGYEGYIDLYARDMKNVIEFSGGMMNLFDNLRIEDHLYLGNGKSYGAEFFLKKKKGKLTGYLSYTLSRSERTFNEINEGNTFPFKYDRTHDLTLVSDYKLNARWNLSALFTLATGNAYTKPVSRYLIAGNVVNEYGEYNSSRMPLYHRLDLSAGYQFRTGKYKSVLSLSVYNVYNKSNPMFNYYMARGSLNSGRVSVQEKSIALLPVLPAINYKVIFR
ncbi:TonB-dependent receptor [Pedobacter caeni]|uniref:Outer membrane receptor proteins, mostly Fe transport n=1 Tax=Pedobacter caeni TaxID=288992 RepID=A0A1M5GCI3_9SPHI|nr:TonB-dependent receptor [Pedobacter caeni]SHG01406.1 Outer membrane receptor proteins, mostly Fe transport [Pedobacter caeni]